VHFCDKKDRSALSENPTVRSEALHVFGVDFFSEKEILEYFSEGNPSKVEWINDSSCNVVFPSAEAV